MDSRRGVIYLGSSAREMLQFALESILDAPPVSSTYVSLLVCGVIWQHCCALRNLAVGRCTLTIHIRAQCKG